MEALFPAKRNAISTEVSRYFIEKIKIGSLKAGDKLPSERELSDEFQVSRVSLREGMRTLAFMNILEIRSGDGTYVGTLEPQDLIEPIEFVMAISKQSILDMLEARLFVEPHLASQAANRISENELQELNQVLRQMQDPNQDFKKLTELDVDLHGIIARAAQNPFLFRFMNSLRYLGHKSREKTIQIEEIKSQSQKDHRDIVAAINASDPEKAELAMRDHLHFIIKTLHNRKNSEELSL